MINEVATRTNEVIKLDMATVQGFEGLQRAAKLLSSSSLVPKEFQGAQGLPSCVIALNLASRIGADPLMCMQNLYVVHGRPSWSSKFLIATFNQCGKFSALRYEFIGQPGTDDFGCRAWAVEKATGEKLIGPLVTIGIAKKEGWFGKTGSKWQTMPDQMIRYRSASWFINTSAPELAMGLPAADELEDALGSGAVPEMIIQYEPVPADVPESEVIQPEIVEAIETPQNQAKSRAEMLKDKIKSEAA